MENCLVTKLKAVVDNDNLIYNDALKVTVVPNNGVTSGMSIRNTDGRTVKYGGLGVIFKMLSNCHVYKDNDILDVNGIYTIEDITDWSAIKPIDNTLPMEYLMVGLTKITNFFNSSAPSYVRMRQVDLNRLKYLSNLDEVITSFRIIDTLDATLDANYIKDLTFDQSQVTSLTVPLSYTVFKINLSSFSGFINTTSLPITIETEGDLSSIANLTKVTLLNFNSATKVTGNIESLAGMTNLNTLLCYGSTIKGSIEAYVAARVVASGSQSGSLNDFNPNGIITFNGTAIPAGTHKTITWTSANPEDITVTNKV